MLKRELVQVQTLMDNMTREREEESARLRNEYEQLQRNFTTSEVRLLQITETKRSHLYGITLNALICPFLNICLISGILVIPILFSS